jgi:hypothetical protein
MVSRTVPVTFNRLTWTLACTRLFQTDVRSVLARHSISRGSLTLAETRDPKIADPFIRNETAPARREFHPIG